AGHGGSPFDAVEYEELVLGSEQGGIADAGGKQIVLGPLGNRARVTVVALHGGGLDNVAANDNGGFFGEGVDDGAAVVGHEDHVGLADALPAGHGRAIKHFAVFKKAVINDARGHGDMLLFPSGVGETQIHPLGFVFVNESQSVL